MNTITDKAWILGFLSGTRNDYRGRSHQEILAFDNGAMEECHDQIQWVFPLHEESNFAATYPIVDEGIVSEAATNPDIAENLRKAKTRMERFLGVGEHYDIERHKDWCVNGNHNLLRITRVIRSLCLFGMQDEAIKFYDKVAIPARDNDISDFTLGIWLRALYEDVWSTLRN